MIEKKARMFELDELYNGLRNVVIRSRELKIWPRNFDDELARMIGYTQIAIDNEGSDANTHD